MTLQRKLLLGFSLMVLPTLLVGIQAIRTNALERGTLETLRQRLAHARTYDEVEDAMFNQTQVVWRYLSGDPAAKREFPLTEQVVDYWLDRWAAGLPPDDIKLADGVRKIEGDIRAVAGRVFTLYDSGQRQAAYLTARQEFVERLQPALATVNREIYRQARDRAALSRRNRGPGTRLRSDDRAAPSIPRAAGAVRETGFDRSDGGGGGPRAAEPAGEPTRGGAARPAPRRGPRRPRTAAGHRRAGRSARSSDRSPAGILPAYSVPPAPRKRARVGRGHARRLLRAAPPATGRAGDELSGGPTGDSGRSDALGAGVDRDRLQRTRCHAPPRRGAARDRGEDPERRGRREPARARDHGLGARDSRGDSATPV